MADLAERWRCSAGKVRTMIAAGDLACMKHGRMVRVSADVVAQFETQPPTPPPEPPQPNAAMEAHLRAKESIRIIRMVERTRAAERRLKGD